MNKKENKNIDVDRIIKEIKENLTNGTEMSYVKKSLDIDINYKNSVKEAKKNERDNSSVYMAPLEREYKHKKRPANLKFAGLYGSFSTSVCEKYELVFIIIFYVWFYGYNLT